MTMDKPNLIAKLNEAIGLELAALLQYNQYSHVLLGRDRMVWEDFFSDTADEALKHARKFASRVVSLGGTPCVEPAEVKQTNDLTEMLENSLAIERRAVQVYTEALEFCGNSVAYRNMLEDQIQDESEDVEELEKYLNKVQKVGEARPSVRKSKSA